MGQNEDLRVIMLSISSFEEENQPISIQDIFDAVDTEKMGDIYQRELIVYLKDLHGGKFANLKVNQTKPNQTIAKFIFF